MTDLEKAIELARKHEGLFGARNREECCVAACQEMAEWKEKKMIERAVIWLSFNCDVFGYFKKGKLEYMLDKFTKAMEGGEKC